MELWKEITEKEFTKVVNQLRKGQYLLDAQWGNSEKGKKHQEMNVWLTGISAYEIEEINKISNLKIISIYAEEHEFITYDNNQKPKKNDDGTYKTISINAIILNIYKI